MSHSSLTNSLTSAESQSFIPVFIAEDTKSADLPLVSHMHKDSEHSSAKKSADKALRTMLRLCLAKKGSDENEPNPII